MRERHAHHGRLTRRGRHVAGQPRTLRDAGQESVSQALLITGVSIGALAAGSLARVAVDGMNTVIAALG